MNEVGCKLIIYDDKNISYITGNIYEINVEPHYLECASVDTYEKYVEISKTYSVTTNNPINDETIKLDETLMKRIAKFNKEIEIKKLDETIKNKQEKIKELDNLLQDKEKKDKAMYVLNCKGKDLTKAVRELVDELAKQFDEMQKK